MTIVEVYDGDSLNVQCTCFPNKLVHEASKWRSYQDTQGQPAQCYPHGISSLLVVRVPVSQHPHAGHTGAGRPDTLQGPGEE